MTSLGAIAQSLMGQGAPAPLSDLIAGYFAPPAAGAPPVAQASGTPQTPGGYQVLDYKDLWIPSDAPAAGGLVQATYPAVDPTQMWLVDRMVVYTNSAATTTAFVYIGQVSAQNVRAGTEAGNLDFAHDPTGMLVPGSLPLIVVWEGAADGALAGVAIQYRVLG